MMMVALEGDVDGGGGFVVHSDLSGSGVGCGINVSFNLRMEQRSETKW